MGFTGECWNESYEYESEVLIYLFIYLFVWVYKKFIKQKGFFPKKKQNAQFDLLTVPNFSCWGLNMLISRDAQARVTYIKLIPSTTRRLPKSVRFLRTKFFCSKK